MPLRDLRRSMRRKELPWLGGEMRVGQCDVCLAVGCPKQQKVRRTVAHYITTRPIAASQVIYHCCEDHRSFSIVYTDTTHETWPFFLRFRPDHVYYSRRTELCIYGNGYVSIGDDLFFEFGEWYTWGGHGTALKPLGYRRKGRKGTVPYRPNTIRLRKMFDAVFAHLGKHRHAQNQ